MEGSSQEDLTTRSLLKGILATEPIRSAVKQKNKRRVSELESLLSLSSSGSFHKLTKNASMPSPSMNLRNKMKEKVRRSIGKTASRPSTGKRVAQTDSHSKKRPVRRTRPFVEELDKITPRTLLKKIIQIEPEVSMIVSQRSELTEPKDTNQEIASDHTINSISNLELNLPELEEEERVTAFGNARKKYRISITEFERGVGERLPPTQESSSNKWMEESGNHSVLSHSLRILLGSPEPELSQKHGLVRRPKKHRLISLKDFEQGVEQNYQLLKGSQECFIDSTEDETSSTSDTSPTENANMNTKLYDLPTLKEKRSHASDTKLEAISEDQLADGAHKEEEKPVELTPGLNHPKDRSPRKSERLQGLKEDNQIYGRTGEKNRDELMEADHDLQKSDEESLSTERSHQTEELKLLAHESEQSSELIDSDVEVVVGTPETHTSHLRVDALRVARMTTSAKKDIRSRSILFESSQGGGISLHQVQNLTDIVFTRLSPEDSGHKKGAHLSASIKHTEEVVASYPSGSESGNELDLDNQTGPSSVSDPYPIEQTTPQQNIQELRQTPGASITQTESRHKSVSASVTKRMSVLQPQTEEAKDQTLEESDNEGEELEESHRKELQPFSHTKSRTPTSHIERHLKSTSTTKTMSVQQPQSDEVKEQTVEEQKNEEEEPMESDNEEFQPSLWTKSRASTSRMEQHLKSASINKRKSVRNSQTQEPINQTVEESDNEAEDSESNAVQPSSWTEPPPSTSRTEKRLKSASITKWMTVQPKSRESKDQDEEECDNEIEEQEETGEESDGEEFQPISHTKSRTPTSHIERHLKSTSITKRMSVQQPQSDEVKEQTVEEQKNEEEEPMESDNEEFQPSLWTKSRASTSRMEQHLKSASINKRKSVRNLQTQEPINQTVEESDNEAEDSESNAVQPSSWTEPPPSTSRTEKRLKSASITKWMTVQPKSRESKDQDEEECDNEIEEQEETGEESDGEEFQPISHTKSRTPTSHIERHLKSTSITKRMSVQQPQSDEVKGQTVEEQKNEEEEPMESDNEEFQPSLWTKSRASTSRMEQHLKSASINKRKSVRNSQTQEPINQTVEESDNEAEDSESNAVQPSSWTEPPPSTSRTEKRLKSASITKWMNVQPKSSESKDQDEEECDNEIEEQEETGEESDGEEQSIAENPMSSTQKLSLSPLPDTPAYFKNGRFRLAKKPPPVGKRTQKKKHTETSKKEPMMPRSYIKQAFSHYAQTRVAKNAYQEVEKCLGLYMDQLSVDLAVYSAHASRKTVTRADIELLMRRQGLVTDKTSLNTLIAQHLPLDYRKLLVPCASSGNKVFPKM